LLFERVKGVQSVVSGYSGGDKKTAHAGQVEGGKTGHAESVMITYDPSKITYGQILKIFCSVAHDPTQLNRQGGDTGPQYRSVVFYASEEQKKAAESYIAQLEAAKVFQGKIVTEVVPLKVFYPAEGFLQHYSEKHPDDPYVVQVDLPKLRELKQKFPELANTPKD
jgi:peptide-methionine (S)-S-oxide reductase